MSETQVEEEAPVEASTVTPSEITPAPSETSTTAEKSSDIDNSKRTQSKVKFAGSQKEDTEAESYLKELPPIEENVDIKNLEIDGEMEEEEEEEVEEEEPKISIFEILDAPRELPEPVDLTLVHLKQIADELGLITLCWPELKDVVFEERYHFPESYLQNNNKEKLLLLYTENFRRQFHHKFPIRKQIFLAGDNECGLQKMVCTTIRPTTFPYPEIESWEECAKFVADQLKYEPLEIPTLAPSRLYSPHTVFLRQSGQSYEIATALCSLLLGLGYDACVVSGYATRDVTLRIMLRVDSPFPPEEEKEEVQEKKEEEQKYIVKPPRDLRSQFLLAMEQREIDKAIEEKHRQEEVKRLEREEEEKPPFDDLFGLRVHGWVLLLPGSKDIEEPIFIEPSTGASHPVDSPLYCGIETIWNNENYWINMQDCSEGLGSISYDLSVIENWEHLLIGEPLQCRQSNITEDMEEDDINALIIQEEKHLDMPSPWSLKISIPHDVLKKRFPEGKKVTTYKRTIVEQYAPYVLEDGLVTKINRYDDMDCTNLFTIEEKYENRHDNLLKIIIDCSSDLYTEYFEEGREDGVKIHVYHRNSDVPEAERTIEYYHKARYDGLSKLEINPVQMVETYVDREDHFYYRQITYAERGHPPPGMVEGNRRIVVSILEKFYRDEHKKASEDIAIREFAVIDREIHLKYHYDKGKVTASTRDFIKPPLAEMGDAMKFNPELTFGYQAEIGAKPPRQLQLFMLFEEQLKEEEKALYHVRDMEDQVVDFLGQRTSEIAFPKLDVSLFNREQNAEHRRGMLEREQQQREHKEKEIEEDIDYLAPYLARIGDPHTLSYNQAVIAREECLSEFKQLLIDRANDIQHQFDTGTQKMLDKQNWYSENQDSLKPEEEEQYFHEVNDMTFSLHALEIRLGRHRELSPYRYEALLNYLKLDPRLSILNTKF